MHRLHVICKTQKPVARLYNLHALSYKLYSGDAKKTRMTALSAQAAERQTLKQVGGVVLRSASWMLVACALSTVMPVSTPEVLQNLVLGFGATRPFQVLVNTKLGMQAKNVHVVGVTSPFFLRESRAFVRELAQVIQSEHPEKGARMYACRGAIAKMMTFTGYDVVQMGLKTVCPDWHPLVLSASAGALSGAIQGGIVAFPEYLSTLQSRNPGKTNAEFFAEMKTYMAKTKGAPIIATMARNGMFDMVFNVLRCHLGLPFGVSAGVALTSNYVIEKQRSLFQQHTEVDVIKESFKRGNWFDGWLGKVIEFILIFQFLQILKENVKRKATPPTSEHVHEWVNREEDSPCSNPHKT